MGPPVERGAGGGLRTHGAASSCQWPAPGDSLQREAQERQGLRHGKAAGRYQPLSAAPARADRPPQRASEEGTEQRPERRPTLASFRVQS